MIERKPASTIPLSEVREAIVKALRDGRTEQNRVTYIEDHKKAKPPMINQDALKDIRVKP